MQEKLPEYNGYRISVPPEFETIFSHFYFAENMSEEAVTKTLLPTYQTILLFCFGESASMVTKEKTKITVDKCIVFGPIRNSFDYTLPAKTSILVANFKDDAFYRFFGKACISYNAAMNPDDLLDENCFTNLWYQISALNSTQKQVDHILEFCKPYLQSRDTTSQLLSNFTYDNLNPIKTIAEKTNQSERNIQLKQKQQFGYSSKEINRYNRFSKAIQLIEKKIANQNKVEWFTIIDECNYYDQSQLIHDFKHFIHLSPSQYLKFQQDICNPKSE
ncbi:helix-turn-helix transcriptional regulator [Chryseobacterium paridis]|uniref:Helix-turn-helix transcriptional regulator n=1 Tax=Chryseobacterium paridis TaxID=2800328 RepID=A0ABS1FZC2_9FLAO|nr:helix-turn-helix transcriptional regulator [Chryseobacterium paridis]MBK1897796.1 helix-turn-helix transcriptional regulator [Chryseobacterium paridis]